MTMEPSWMGHPSFNGANPMSQGRDMGHGGFKLQVQQRMFKTSLEILENCHGKDGNKERFPLSHGTAAAIYMN
jgi:hypothetical protein